MATMESLSKPAKTRPKEKEHYIITDKQIEVIEATFLKHTSAFVSSGTVPLKSERLVLYYSKDGDSKDASIITLPLSADAAQEIYTAGQPSLFGRDQENVLDESYRCAHELRPPNFALSTDTINEEAILPYIQQNLAIELPLRAELSKLNAYPTGGFFKAHRDTPRGEDHIGTLTMCLPSHFKGGELVVRHRNGTATFDWATEVKGTPAETGQVPVIAWTFLFSDCDHEVLPVTEGTRITIAYDVFIVPCNDTERSKFRDPAVEELSATLRAALKNPSFFPDGGAMAFGLQHAYPIQTFDAEDTDDHYIGGHLKGVDQMWLSAAKAVGLEWSICGMYDFELNDSDHWGTSPPRGDRYIYKNRDYAAAKGFELFEGASFGEYDSMDVHGSSMFTGKNVAWVTLPGDWCGTNSYMTYGNEWNSSSTYVTVALVLQVPPPAERG